MTVIVTTTSLTTKTLTDLKADIAAWMHRTDLTDQMGTFIRLGEASLTADIVSNAMETKSTTTTTANLSYVAMPADIIELRRAQILSSYNTVLKYASPDQLSADYSENRTGIPSVFTIVGSNMELAPVPDGVYTIELTYKQRVPPLTDSNPSNWLLTAWYDAYLYACLLAARLYIKDMAMVAALEKLYTKSVDNINTVDWYTGSTMRVKAR